jgi:hypothetical protein
VYGAALEHACKNGVGARSHQVTHHVAVGLDAARNQAELAPSCLNWSNMSVERPKLDVMLESNQALTAMYPAGILDESLSYLC